LSETHNTAKLDLSILFLMACYTLLVFIPGLYDNLWYQFLLAPALLFPGLSHGAADHHLDWQGKPRGLSLFILRYIAIMLLVAGIWLLFPILGLFIFLLFSAWHFGETDLREWGIYNPIQAFLFGLGILGLLLLTHLPETVGILTAMETAEFGEWLTVVHKPGILFSVACCLIPAVRLPVLKCGSYFILLLMLALGVLLPLFSAFLWYFCAWHSIRGWMHLRILTGYSNQLLLRVAYPFTLGALVFFAVLLLFYPYFIAAEAKSYAILFVFIAALSTPHIITMHNSYHKNNN
jgi:Brp/Blh family beta-carotene 15,15'-monooxygenase